MDILANLYLVSITLWLVLVFVMFCEVVLIPFLGFLFGLAKGLTALTFGLAKSMSSGAKSHWSEFREWRYRRRITNVINKTWPKDWSRNYEFMGIEVPERYKTMRENKGEKS